MRLNRKYLLNYVVQFQNSIQIHELTNFLSEMFLIGPNLIRTFELCIKYSRFFNVIPFQWNSDLKLLQYIPQSNGNYLNSWNFMRYVVLAHGLIVAIRFVQSGIEVSRNVEWLNYFVIDSLGLLTFALFSFFQITMMDKGRAMTVFFNRFIKYYVQLQGNCKLYLRGLSH